MLRPIKKTGILLPELMKVDRIIEGPLLTNSRARVVWFLLKVAKKKDMDVLLGLTYFKIGLSVFPLLRY